MLRVIFASVALTSTAVAADDMDPVAADINVVEDRTNAVAPMKVQNKGSKEVTLKNCEQSFVVAPGKHMNLKVNKASKFWVVPTGMSWDCNKGPFNLFHVVADFHGPKLFAGIGYGHDKATDKAPKESGGANEESKDEPDEEPEDEPDEEPEDKTADQKQVETEQKDAKTSEASHDSSKSVAGVELVAVSASSDGTRAIRCREDACDVDQEVDLVPTSFTLNLIGADKRQLRGNHYHGFWRGRRYGPFRRYGPYRHYGPYRRWYHRRYRRHYRRYPMPYFGRW